MVGVRLVIVVVVVVVIIIIIILLFCKKGRFCLCVRMLHIYIRINKYLSKKNYFQNFQFIFCETYACIISTPPLSSFNNNNGQNIDL